MLTPSEQQRRLTWQCRRGLLELDVLLDNFLTQRYPHLSTDMQQQFAALLACSDQDLIDWLLTGKPVSQPSLEAIVARIKAG